MSNLSVDSTSVSLLRTVAVTPEVSPLILIFFVANTSVYELTVTFINDASNLTEV